MSRREHFCNRRVAARRAVSPFAGLRRVRLTRSTPEIRRFRGVALHRADAIACIKRSAAEVCRRVGAVRSAERGWRLALSQSCSDRRCQLRLGGDRR